MMDWSLREEWQSADIRVPYAALLAARQIAYPTLDVDHYLQAISDLVRLAAERVGGRYPILVQAEQLSDFLFTDLGFAGNSNDYDDPRNSFLNDVLERRCGLPITLSIIYVEVARQLGLPAYGIGLPGHFIVGIRDGDESHWRDPFHGGRRLSLNDCVEIIEATTGYEGPLDAAWFSPISPRDTLTRLANNLRTNYVYRKDWTHAASAIQVLQMMQPEASEHLRDLGLIYLRQQSIPQAAYFLNEYLTQSPNASDAAMIRQGTKQLFEDWAALN